MTARTIERVAEFVVVVGVEIFLYLRYLSGDGTFHYLTHFFAGATLALALMTLAARRWRRPVRFPLLMVLIGHLIAMTPDMAYIDDVAHERWMDVFVAHNISHFIPGRNLTWYLLFLASLTLYLVAAPRPPGVVPHEGREPSDEQPQILQARPASSGQSAGTTTGAAQHHPHTRGVMKLYVILGKPLDLGVALADE